MRWRLEERPRRLYYRHRFTRGWEVAHTIALSELALRHASELARINGPFDILDTWMWGAEGVRYSSPSGPWQTSLQRLEQVRIRIRADGRIAGRCEFERVLTGSTAEIQHTVAWPDTKQPDVDLVHPANRTFAVVTAHLRGDGTDRRGA